ncbi:unnamed protein product [Fraxinus pennsylvanica]|uniref:Pirin C-terminal domain-containing protein n=1 Tax=Fraxinus pennsylvanica TaxID=56036 RepID=A0AAD2DYZ5_9LAMI|nr:unnamed protein product [Fraxinus pennsylvanica]
MYLDFCYNPMLSIIKVSRNHGMLLRTHLKVKGLSGIPNSSPSPSLGFGPPGEGLSVWNKSTMALRFILVGGQPLNEPVVKQGPFVVNKQAEIEKTIKDCSCKNGLEMARCWRSK